MTNSVPWTHMWLLRMGVGERKGRNIMHMPWYTWGDFIWISPNVELFINNPKGFFLDIPPMYRCICFEWIIYLCKGVFCIVPGDVFVNS